MSQSEMSMDTMQARRPAEQAPDQPAPGASGGGAVDAVRVAGFPKLGWVCERRPDGTWSARIGDHVDLLNGGLIEGCWAGPFEEGGFLGSPNLFGSGVAMAAGQTWFCPPAHTCDALFAVEHGGRRLVSNSLFLLLRESGVALDPEHNYTRALFTLAYGIDEAAEVLYRNADTTLYRILYDDFTFESGAPQRRRKADVTVPLNSYADYHRYIIDTAGSCARNASASGRRSPHTLVATVSSGYDSTAAAAVGKAIGCNRAITVRSGRHGIVDTGRPAAEAMGLTCIERERIDPAQQTDRSEIEFLMSGSGGGDYPISAFTDVLENSLCLTGYLGDMVWDLHGQPNSTLARGDNIGVSLSEFRLRVGYFHLPVPFIAARRHADIQRISRGEEMRPWTIGGDYDRPIARRMIEETGVPRGLFAQSKKGMALIFSWGPMFLSPAVRQGFNDFLRERGSFTGVYARHAAFHLGHVSFRIARKLKDKLGADRLLGGTVKRMHRAFRAYENSPFPNLLFIWAMNEVLSGRFKPGSTDAARAGESAAG